MCRGHSEFWNASVEELWRGRTEVEMEKHSDPGNSKPPLRLQQICERPPRFAHAEMNSE
jgi:hypothetical protein